MKKSLLLSAVLLAIACQCPAQDKPDWVLEATAPWQPRDSQVECVFRNQLWIMGGWFQSYAEPPRDVWSSADGKTWKQVLPNAPWLHSDLATSIAFHDRMWVMGGWYKGRLDGHSASNQAWSSADGIDWRQETANAGWSPRGYLQAVVLNGKMFVLGGGNYVPTYHAKNDVWSSDDGVHWTRETEAAPWSPRLWFSAATYRGQMWVLGGWSKEKDNFGDVWHSTDGKTWQKLETNTCWKARHEHSVFVFQDKLWVAGGHARPLSSEVWSLKLPPDWKPEVAAAQPLPMITLPLRVHLMQSDTMPAMHTTLVEADVRRIVGKVNNVWAQAGIHFEIESIGPTQATAPNPETRLKSEFDRVKSMIPKARLSADALDVCYVKEVQPNGFYYGEPIVVKDTASLREVPGGIDEPLPRVTAHEIGHALGLKHRQDTTNLMQSGTTGFGLNDAEIAIARKKALVKKRR